MKYYILKNGYGEEKVYLKRNTYANNGRLAVEMYTADHDLYDVITVNIVYGQLSGDKTQYAFVDTNNGGSWGVKGFLRQYGIAKPTGKYVASGHCTYPEYCFDLSKIGGVE